MKWSSAQETQYWRLEEEPELLLQTIIRPLELLPYMYVPFGPLLGTWSTTYLLSSWSVGLKAFHVSRVGHLWDNTIILGHFDFWILTSPNRCFVFHSIGFSVSLSCLPISHGTVTTNAERAWLPSTSRSVIVKSMSMAAGQQCVSYIPERFLTWVSIAITRVSTKEAKVNYFFLVIWYLDTN